MAASADFDPRTAQHSLNLQTRTDGVLVPGGDWLLTAAFARSGPDLLIHGPDGKSAIVANYFATEEPAPLTTDSGARLNGAVVELLAGPRAPLQYAEVQSAQASDATGAIGEVIDVQGVVQVTRADGSQAQLGQGDAVFLRDVVQAAPDGTISIRFVDGTTFALSDGARMTLDDLVYNPGGGDNVFSASVLQGAFIFLTGQIAPSGSMDVTTPVGTIGVRGTKVVCKLAVEGQESTITLLVDPSGHVGIVDVTNAGGTRILDQANEATRVISFFVQPSEPVILSQPELLQLFDDVINLINQQNQGESDGSSDAASNEEPDEGTDADTALTAEEAAEIEALDTAAGPELLPIDLYTPPQIGGPSQDFLDQALFVITNYTFQFDSSQTGESQFAPDAPPSSDIHQTDDPAPTPEPSPSPFTVISGGNGNDSLGSGGGSGRFQISGNVGDDALTGGDLGDILDGGDGDDVLDPGSGDDVVQGGAGNDLIIGGSGEGNDSLDGGADVDTVKYQSATQDITVNLTTGTASGDPAIGTDSLDNLENVIGGGGNDTITGNGSANVLDGGLGNDAISSLAGDDTLVGGAGNDFLDGGDDVDVAVLSGKLSDYTVTKVGGQLIVADLRPDGDGTDTLQNIEGIKFADQQVDTAIFKVPTAVDDTSQLNEGQQAATNGAAMKTTVTVAAGAVLTLRFNFLDSEPLLDEAFFKDFAVVVIDGQVIPLADVDDATGPVGAATLGFDDQTGYLTFTFTFASAGTYDLGLAVLNEGDTAFDAGLLVDAVSISGGAFSDGFESGLDGWTILGNVGAQGDFEGITPPEGAQQAVLVSNGAQPSAIEPFLGLAAGALANAANQPAVTGNVLSNDDFGPDGPGGVVDIVYAGNPVDVESTTGGGVTTITAADGSWRLEFDLVTGQYSFTVLAPIEHPGAGVDTLTFAFTYTIEDANGDSSQATLTIDVVDGVPVAVDDLQQVAIEGGGDIAGNVFANDQPGLDGAVLTHVLQTGGAAPIAVPGSGPLVVTTDLGGTLTVFANGDWSYTPPADLPGSGTASDGFTYTVTDGDGDQSSATQDILVQQGGTDEPPSAPVDEDVAANAVAENAANGVAVGVTALSLDPDGDPVTYSLTDSAGGRFAINATTGVVTVANGNLLDFESVNSHQIKVQATSGGLSSEQTFAIDVTNVNEPPSIPTDNDAAPNEVAEDAAAGTVVGVTALSVDPDGDPVTYSLISDGGGRFKIDEGGLVTVADGAQFDFESAAKFHQITVQATSSGGLSTTDSFVIAVTDVNEAPTITSDGGGPTVSVLVAENQAAVTTVVAADPDVGDEVSYSIAGGFDGNLFEIDQTTGQLKFVSAQDFENPDLNGGSFDHLYDVLVRATDKSGNIREQLITLTLTDVNEAPGTPVDANVAPNTVAENATNGTLVGITALSVDPDSGDTVTYSLTDNAGGRFAIDSGTGIVTVANGGLLNFENAESHEIKVKATSDGGLSSVEQTSIIDVANVNEPPSAPVDTNGAANQVAENAAAGTAVGITAFSLDPDAGDTISYALSDDAGGLFAIGVTTGVVTVANGAVLTDGVYEIKVEASSSGGLSAGQTFSITVTDADDAPVLINKTLVVAKGGVDLVQPSELKTDDADTLPSQIVYTLTALPTLGALLLDGLKLESGDVFTQEDIADGSLKYEQNGVSGSPDSFQVDISDGTTTLSGQSVTVNIVQFGVVADADSGSPNVDDPLIVGDTAYGRLDVLGDGELGGASVEATSGITAGNTATGVGTIRIEGPGATLAAGGDGLEIGDAGHGSLLVGAGASVTANRLVIGNQAGSIGFVSVGGAESLIATKGDDNAIVVGGGGIGTLLVESGGRVTGLQLVIGDQAASDGVVTVEGGGSEIVISNDDGAFGAPDEGDAGEVLVGNNGSGGLFVLDGGRLEVRTGVSPNDDTTRPILAIGVETGSNGEVLVSGETSTVALSMSGPADPSDLSDLLRGPGIAVGLKGTGTMTVQDLATVTLAGEEAFISVGVGNHLDPDDITKYPAATLTLTTGAKIEVTDTAGGDGGLIVGDFKSGTGTVTVSDGAMISIVSDGGASVGHEGEGTLLVKSGGKMLIESDQFNNLVIGEADSGVGHVIVDGAGSQIVTSGTDNTVQVGYQGEGKLEVTNGGLVSTLELEIGRGGTGTVTIDGAGSKIIASNDGGRFEVPQGNYAGFVSIGRNDGSNGALSITNGGVLEIRPGELANTDTVYAELRLGRDKGSIGSITVDGSGSAINIEGPDSSFVVGRAGEGILTVTNGGQINSGFLQFGSMFGGSGTGLVSGAGSAINVTGDQSLNIGRDGHGALTVQDGGVVSGTFIHVGREATGDGEVVVTGAGSKLISAGTNDSSFNVGRYGSGELTVSNGGLVEAQNFSIGRYAGSVGVVEVSGAGSKLVTGGLDNAIQVGRQGTGSLTIEGGALVKTLNLAVGREGSGTVAIDGKGTMVVVSSDEGLNSEPYAYEAGFVRVSRNLDSSGSLTVTGGAMLEIRSGIGQNENTYAAAISIGRDKGSSGYVLVSGEGSLISITQEVVPDGPRKENGPYASVNGNSTLTVQDQGQIVIEGVYAALRVGTSRYADAQLEVIGDGSILIDSKSAGGGLRIGGNFEGVATGFVHVGGDGSSIIVDGDGSSINVGNGGHGSLLIDGGGLVEGKALRVDSYAGGSGIVNVIGKDGVTGVESILRIVGTGGIQIVGEEGSGELHVAGGAKVLSTSDNFNNLDIISDDKGDGIGWVTVDGAGSLIQTFGIDNTVQVGRYGEGKLDVTNGGGVSTLHFEVGRTGTGTATISGDGSKIVASNDGGLFGDPYANQAGFVRIGRDYGSSGTLIIDKGGRLEVRPGATVNTDTIYAGIQVAKYAGSTGAINISGKGSAIVVEGVDNGISIGYGGSGTLSVTSEAQITTQFIQFGRDAGSTGSGVVSGIGTSINAGGVDSGVLVGRFGTGSLTIEDGGSVTTDFVNIGRGATGVGEIVVTGEGSILATEGANDGINVGREGTGTLKIENEGTVDTGSINIAHLGGSGSVIVSGEGSSLTVDGIYGDVIVGRAGLGLFAIEDGGDVEARFFTVGHNAGGTGTAFVTGIGSQLVLTGDENRMWIGTASEGDLEISNGGLVKALAVDIGGYEGTGSATVNGAGSALIVSNDTGNHGGGNEEAAGSLSLGGDATLDIKDGGLVEVRAGTQNPNAVRPGLDVGANSPSTGGRVWVHGEGSLLRISQTFNAGNVFSNNGNAPALTLAAGMALVTVENGGAIEVLGPGARVHVDNWIQDSEDTPTLQVFAGGKVLVDGKEGNAALLVETNSAGSSTAVVISGGDALLKVTGGGNENSFVHIGYGAGSGRVTVSEGGRLEAGISGDSDDVAPDFVYTKIDVQVFEHGALDGGGGTIVGDIAVGKGGILTAGDGHVATMTIDGNLLVPEGTMVVDASGDDVSDHYAISGEAEIWGATFVFNFVKDYVPGDGDSFAFLTADGGLNDVNLDTIALLVNGVQVGSENAFSVNVDGSSLVFSSSVGAVASNGVWYRGTVGDDTFVGTAGQDEIYGRAGNDTLTGGGGKDAIDGGAGSDSLFYLTPTDGQQVATNQLVSASGATGDLISNFDATIGTGDKFQFDSTLFQSVSALNFASIGTEYNGTNAGGAVYIVDSQNHLIYDDNGNADGYTVLATVDLADGSPAIDAGNLQTV